MKFADQYEAYLELIEGYLDKFIKKQDSIGKMGYLQDAMAYSLLGEGKRIRPILVLASCEMLGGPVEEALPFACAVELVHTYSLIHDDLPAMDDDDLRRGQPSCHKKFDEASAILAGDALLTAAFAEISTAPLSPPQVVAGIQCLSTLAGSQGMVGGQALELFVESEDMNLQMLQKIQSMKTGALLVASCHLGAIVAGANKEARMKLSNYASSLGVAFQLRDDILDVTGSEDVMGKPVGSDAKLGKVTAYSLLGEEKTAKFIQTLTQEAQMSLTGLPHPEFLQQLVKWLATRPH